MVYLLRLDPKIGENSLGGTVVRQTRLSVSCELPTETNISDLRLSITARIHCQPKHACSQVASDERTLDAA